MHPGNETNPRETRDNQGRSSDAGANAPETAPVGVEAPPVCDSDLEGEAARARWGAFVAARRWTFAKTYVRTYPHEWTSCKPNTDPEMMWAARYVRHNGVREPFWGWKSPYLYHTGPDGTHKYWTMTEAVESLEIINRCFPDPCDHFAQLPPEQATPRLQTVWKELARCAREMPSSRRDAVQAACAAYLRGETDTLTTT